MWKIYYTVFPRIVSAESILFWIWPYVLWPLETVHKNTETIKGRKLIKGRNYLQKYDIFKLTLFYLFLHKICFFILKIIRSKILMSSKCRLSKTKNSHSEKISPNSLSVCYRHVLYKVEVYLVHIQYSICRLDIF